MTIICGFPGVGKSHAARLYGLQDSDSSTFKDDWPNAYLDHLEAQSGIVLASTHEEVRQGLHERGLPFWIVFPAHASLFEYRRRFQARGDSEEFRKLLTAEWANWLFRLQTDSRAAVRIELSPDTYLADVLGLGSTHEDGREEG